MSKKHGNIPKKCYFKYEKKQDAIIASKQKNDSGLNIEYIKDFITVSSLTWKSELIP